MPEVTEGRYRGEFIYSEACGSRSLETVTIDTGDLSAGTVLGKILTSTPTTGTAAGGNTGNGTMTAVTGGDAAKVGVYTATCTAGSTGAVTTPATGTADGGNTGNGTMTAVSAGADVQAGTYTVECTSVPAGAAVVPATGTADGGNAGANTMTAVSGGAAVKIGTYSVVCTDATVGGSEIFQVTDPDGLLLAPATVAVPYVNAQILFTINDPGNNAQVADAFTIAVTEADHNSGTFSVTAPDGTALPAATVGAAYINDQINLTINDGAADFVIGDTFTVLASAAAGNGGAFSVVDPDGNRLKDAAIGAYVSAQINFTINDGATDFVAGDSFTVTVAAGSEKYVILAPAATNGTQLAAGILFDNVDATSADIEAVAYVRDCEVNGSEITWPAGISADDKTAAIAQFAARGIIVR